MSRVTILSHSGDPFRDRKEAGRFLAAQLSDYRGGNTVVLGIPRGGVVVAKEVADILNADLDISLSRKIGAPGNPELAIGAVSESGEIFLDDIIVSHSGASKAYIKEAADRQVSEIKRRSDIFRKVIPKTSLKDRAVIIVDDGLATGATMQASLWSARQERPSRLIAACPVASSEAVEKTAGYCDEVIVLRLPDIFGAVGQFYTDFNQTTDEEVIALLKKA